VLITKCLFIAAMCGAFGGTFKKIDPVVKVPVTRVIEVDGNRYEVGYDITATQAGEDWSKPRVGVQGQPRVVVWGYTVQGPKNDIEAPKLSDLPFLGK
jgi:hypothetical protein